MTKIPGMLSLTGAIGRALEVEPGTIAISAELRHCREAFVVTVFSTVEESLVSYLIDGMSGTVEEVARATPTAANATGG